MGCVHAPLSRILYRFINWAAFRLGCEDFGISEIKVCKGAIPCIGSSSGHTFHGMLMHFLHSDQMSLSDGFAFGISAAPEKFCFQPTTRPPASHVQTAIEILEELS